ncbi:MAG: Glycyl-tRNA synthetase [uncultured Thermomicrobiales bacterium]|uniref:Glycine--tRNA ligase n=1 Tax=uncultured Thermomicrobiales bacterium TaxID=1645740 RepID=A0A6J4UMD4_9BACT|nr:MAG: Glycyl-tRNA synthetase [uncultured Thermomicrobiales bacterium]
MTDVASGAAADAAPSSLVPRAATMEKIVALSKRRGFVYPGSDLYGGLANTWDYGPLGVELKNNVKRLWWQTFVHRRRDIVGLDAGILMHPRIWEASGHVENFNDPLVDCKTCRGRFRADHLIEDKLGQHVDGKSPVELTAILEAANLPCPTCGNRTLTAARQFNMMFSTTIGPVEESGTQVFLRPETAQAIFVQYKNILATARQKVPFGVAQIGKVFRNEITPGNFIFRDIEFEQMEIEFFVRPDSAAAAFEDWLAAMRGWLEAIGINPANIRLREHGTEELSHYSSRTIDYEYRFPDPLGWRELYGLANRTDFDLTRHQEFSGEDLTYFEQATGDRFIPHVIEPTFGVDRTLLMLLLDAYDEEEAVDVNGKADTRVVLRLHPRVAPFKAAILPLMKKPELATVARELFERVQAETGLLVDYDETSNIGKRYRRQDEVGTPYCVTVDYETLEDRAVTVRDRDTTAQERVPLDAVPTWLLDRVR